MRYQTDVVIIGAGIAGICAAIELLDRKKKVLLLERGDENHLGGLAKTSFGGLFFVNSPLQRRLKIRDSEALALSDWHSYANFLENDQWPIRWAQYFIERNQPDIHDWLIQQKISFLPAVHWAERGLYVPGNSVPRFHIAWGTGEGIIKKLLKTLLNHPHQKRLKICCEHHVQNLLIQDKRVIGCVGKTSLSHEFEVAAQATLVTSGGIMGDLDKVKKYWPIILGMPPSTILNGAHPYSSGDMHEVVEQQGGAITHLDRHWNYAAGVHHPNAQFENHGLSLVPPKSALWINACGERLVTPPLVSGFDTRVLVEQITKQPGQFSWQILNFKIAKRELAVSGSLYNEAILKEQWGSLIKSLLLGNARLVTTLLNTCVDFVAADSLDNLVKKMNTLNFGYKINLEMLKKTLDQYDADIERSFCNDDQLRRLEQLRRYRPERMRTCHFQKILDKKAGPLIAIRLFILSRKTLGGIKTNLKSEVLTDAEETISGLYAAGEAAGFGGGGIHGMRALEGTFLTSAILTGRVAAKAICSQ